VPSPPQRRCLSLSSGSFFGKSFSRSRGTPCQCGHPSPGWRWGFPGRRVLSIPPSPCPSRSYPLITTLDIFLYLQGQRPRSPPRIFLSPRSEGSPPSPSPTLKLPSMALQLLIFPPFCGADFFFSRLSSSPLQEGVATPPPPPRSAFH